METQHTKIYGLQQAVLRQKFIAINIHIKRINMLNNLTLYFRKQSKNKPNPKLAEGNNKDQIRTK